MAARVLVTARQVVRLASPRQAELEAAGNELVPADFPHPSLDEAALLRPLPGCLAVIAMPDAYTERVLQACAPTLKLIARSGVGYDSVDLAAARERGEEFGPLSWRHEVVHPLSAGGGRRRRFKVADAVLTYLRSEGAETVVEQRFLELARATRSAEELARQAELRERFDRAISRAVAQPPVLLELALPFVRTGGDLLAQVAELDPDSLAGVAQLLGGGTPRLRRGPGERDFLLAVDKVAPTPPEYPRRTGVPNRKPLA